MDVRTKKSEKWGLHHFFIVFWAQSWDASLMLVALFLALGVAEQVTVRLNVMSGGEDPVWRANIRLVGSPCQDVARPLPWYKMGYRGFEITSAHAKLCVYDDFELESALLATGWATVSDAVGKHVSSELRRLKETKVELKQLWAREAAANAKPMVKDNCTAPIRGSDTTTVYSPAGDVCGHWQSHQSENNCYDYGTDIATDTFAQPGRGSGKKWTENTCDNMRDAATRDGLLWNGTTLPSSQPALGHFAALLIWPDTNFHWIRFDSVPAGYWSHKPGSTPVRNVDNNNQPITDPSKSDFSPWTQFCGYMSVVPSKSNIN